MTDTDIIKCARDLCAKDTRVVLYLIGCVRLAKLTSIAGFFVAFGYEYRQLNDPTLVDLVAPIVLAIAVPILYATPLVWFLFRFFVRPFYEK